MSGWMLACLGVLPAWAFCIVMAARGTLGERLVAYQLGVALTTLLLVLMTFAFDQPSLIDLALCLSILGLPGALLFALYAERWL